MHLEPEEIQLWQSQEFQVILVGLGPKEAGHAAREVCWPSVRGQIALARASSDRSWEVVGGDPCRGGLVKNLQYQSSRVSHCFGGKLTSSANTPPARIASYDDSR